MTNQHPDLELYIDDDGYACFMQTENLPPPGIFWTLHSTGWEAFVDRPGVVHPLFSTFDHSFPSDRDLRTAAKEYMILIEKEKSHE